MQENPLISVIVPVFNEARFIRSFMQCLLQQDYPKDKVQVLLVDGGSQDDTLQILQKFALEHPNLHILSNPHRFVPQALNLGLEKASGQVIVRMDVHASYPGDYLSCLVQGLQDTGADNVGGIWQTLPGAKGKMAKGIALALSSPFGVGGALYRIGAKMQTPLEVDTVPFGCYQKEVFERIGRFDEDLLRNQDDELNARLIQAGGKIVLLPWVKIGYYARSSLASLARKMYQYGYYKPLVSKKLGRPATWRQLAPPLLVLALILGLALALVWSWVGYAFVGLCAVYLLFLSLGAWRAKPASLQEGLCAALAMACMHVAYGWGYVRGIFSHWILSAKPRCYKPANNR